MVLTICLILGVALAYFGPVLLRRALDRTGGLDIPPVPETPDPYRIAYLRGGEGEVMRLTLFDLVRRGHLEMTETKRLTSTERRIHRSERAPEDNELSDVELYMVGFFANARNPAEIYRSGIHELLRRGSHAEKTDLTREQMLIPEAIDRRLSGADYLIAALGCLFGIALGVFAFDHAGIGVGIAILFLVARKLVKRHMRRTGHMSALGRKYLAAMQDAYADMKSAAPVAQGPAGRGRDDTLLSVGLYGSAALMGTQYAAFVHMVPHDPAGGFGMEASFGGDGGGGFDVGFGGGFDGGFGGGDGGGV